MDIQERAGYSGGTVREMAGLCRKSEIPRRRKAAEPWMAVLVDGPKVNSACELSVGELELRKRCES